MTENTNDDKKNTEAETLDDTTKPESADPQAAIDELQAQLAEAQAAALYIKAEGENIRRRAMDDIEKARKFALEKFSNELLAVKDSLDAALTVGNADVESYKNGV